MKRNTATYWYSSQ